MRLALLILSISFYCCVHQQKNKHATIELNNVAGQCNFKILDMCFVDSVKLIDSIKRFPGNIEDTETVGHLMLAFDFSEKDSTRLKRRCSSLGFKPFPFSSTLYYPKIYKYYDKCVNGFYRLRYAKGEFFNRIEILNFDEKKYVIFQTGG